MAARDRSACRSQTRKPPLMDNILAAAQTIANARRNRAPLASLSADLLPGDEAEGYRIQRAVHDLLLPQTGSLVGYKIGCTSAVMQQYLDIPHPCAGGVVEIGRPSGRDS